MLPPAAMEVAIELLWEDKLTHPQWPHEFVVPHFMMHMWRRDLGNNADILFTMPAGVPFWGGLQFEPLIVALIFPLAHISDYTGPWAVKGTDMGLYDKYTLKEGFKRALKGPEAEGTHPRGHCGQDLRGVSGAPLSTGGESGQLHGLDGSLPGVFNNSEVGSWALLQKLLASVGQLPPVQKYLVWQMLLGVTKQSLPQAGPPSKWLRPGSGLGLHTELVLMQPEW